MRMSEKDFAALGARKASGGKPKPPSETERKAAVREFLQWRGWEVTNHWQSLGSRKGFPDLTALKWGWTVYIEMKTDRGVQSAAQEDMQAAIEAHGGVYILARGVDDVLWMADEAAVKARIRETLGRILQHR